LLVLTSEQQDQMNDVLRTVFSHYLELEAQHQRQSEDPAGRQTTTIEGLPEIELAKLENELWTGLDRIIPPDQQQIARRNLQIYPLDLRPGRSLSDINRPGFFGWGQKKAEVQIRKIGDWYEWSARIVGTGDSEYAYDGGGRELPEDLARFWQQPNLPAESPDQSR
jgi:hypothetical protein